MLLSMARKWHARKGLGYISGYAVVVAGSSVITVQDRGVECVHERLIVRG